MTNKVKKNIKFCYLLTKKRLYPLILLGFNIFQDVLSKIKDAPIAHNTFRIQPDCSVMC